MNSIEALDVAITAVKADIRSVKFSKTYALALPGRSRVWTSWSMPARPSKRCATCSPNDRR